MTMLETAITRSSTAVLITLLHTHQYIHTYIYYRGESNTYTQLKKKEGHGTKVAI